MPARSRVLLRLLAAPVLIGLAAGGMAKADPRPTAPPAQRPPNVVVILVDDAGFADFGFQGSKQFETPNIDRLAKTSVKFTQAYAAMPFCSPSRAALMTGRYPQRYGYEFNLTQKAVPGVDPQYMGLDVNERTMGDLFKAAGYVTIAVGKWHMGEARQFWPTARGFDHFYGFLGGHSNYFPAKIEPGTILRDDTPAQPHDYLTDDFEGEAEHYIEQNRDRPFLLYMAYNAVHAPMDGRDKDEAKFAGIADPQRRRLAGMTWALDRSIGRLLATLDRLKLTDNTLIVFTNDNGGDRIGIGADNAPLRGMKGTLLEGGVRVPLLVHFPHAAEAGQVVDAPASLMDILPTALDVAGIARPDNLDGRSLRLPPDSQRQLFWRYDVAGAMRDGRWKLIRFPDRQPQLYDLTADPGEQHDQAADHPEIVSAMLRKLFAWEAGVQHPRWNTGEFWSQEDIRRYSDEHVAAENAKERDKLPKAGE